VLTLHKGVIVKKELAVRDISERSNIVQPHIHAYQGRSDAAQYRTIQLRMSQADMHPPPEWDQSRMIRASTRAAQSCHVHEFYTTHLTAQSTANRRAERITNVRRVAGANYGMHATNHIALLYDFRDLQGK
jgi:hypothetical protein